MLRVRPHIFPSRSLFAGRVNGQNGMPWNGAKRAVSVSYPAMAKKNMFRNKHQKGAAVSTQVTPDVEVAFHNDKRSGYSKWLVFAIAQVGILALGSYAFIWIKRSRMNLSKINELKEELTTLETKEVLSTKEQKLKEQLSVELETNSAQEAIPFWEMVMSFDFWDIFFVCGVPAVGVGILIFLRKRISKMAAKIEILNKTKHVRFWLYDGAFARKLRPLEIPFTAFVKTDVEVPTTVSFFTVNVPDYHPGIYIEQRGAKFGNRTKLLYILNGKGNSSSSANETVETVRRQFETKE